MSISKKPNNRDALAFIGGAPDAQMPTRPPAVEPSAIAKKAPAASMMTSGRKQAISLTIAPALLNRVDEAAGRLGLSRAAAISLALARFVDGEDK